MKNKVGLLLATLVLAAAVIAAVVITIKVDNKYLNAQQEPAVEASVSGPNTEKDPGPCENTTEAEFREVGTTEDDTEEATEADDSQSSTSATSGNKKKNNNTAGLNECPKQTDWDDDSVHQESDIYPCDERPDYDDGSEESTAPAEETTPEVSQEASTAAAEEPATEAATEVATEATTEATTAAATDSAPQVDATPASSGNTDSSATTSKAVTQEPELPPAEESFGESAAGKVTWEDPKIPVPDNGDSTEATTEATTTATTEATTEAAATDDWIPTWNDGQTAKDMSTAQTGDPFNQQEDLPSDFGGGGDFEPVE